MKVLVAIADPERESGLLETAAALAGDGEVVLASAIEVTGDATLASAQPEARARRRALDALAGEVPGRHARSLVTVARVAWDAIREACATERPDLLLVAWRRPGWDMFGTTIEAILRQPPCDLAVVKGRPARSKRILVPVRGGRYAQLAARLGIALAKAQSGSVTLLHVAERQGGRRAPTLYQLLGERAYDERVERLVTRSGDPPKAPPCAGSSTRRSARPYASRSACRRSTKRRPSARSSARSAPASSSVSRSSTSSS